MYNSNSKDKKLVGQQANFMTFFQTLCLRQNYLYAEPPVLQSVTEKKLRELGFGTDYKGKMWFYDGTKWKSGQDKTAVNQSPTFDLYDQSGIDFNDTTSYPKSTFEGTKLFSYKKGTGTNDTELGFPLTYRALENTGDIVFDFNLLQDEFTY